MIDDVKRYVAGQRAPISMGFVAAFIGISLINTLTRRSLEFTLPFSPHWLSQPWTLLTYPFVSTISGGLGLVLFIFLMLWMVWALGSAERDLGVRKFLILWGVFSVLPALLIYAAARESMPVIAAPELPLAGMTMLWAIRNKTTTVLLFFLPIPGVWLAAFTVAALFLQFYSDGILVAILACAHLPLAYLVAENKIPGFEYTKPRASYGYIPSKAAKVKESAFKDDVRKREKEREERERLRKLFESSMSDDDR